MLAPLPFGLSADPNVRQWLAKLRDAVNVSPQVVGFAHLSDQSASLASILTVGTAPTLATGLYRVTVQIRVTVPAGVSSAIQPVTTWTDGGVLQTRSGANLTGNTTTDWASDVFLIRSDSGTTVDVTTVYGSVGVPVMQYEIDACVEALPPALSLA